jgi:hypothetical protein
LGQTRSINININGQNGVTQSFMREFD